MNEEMSIVHIYVSRLRGGLRRRSSVSVQVGERTMDKGSEEDNQRGGTDMCLLRLRKGRWMRRCSHTFFMDE